MQTKVGSKAGGHSYQKFPHVMEHFRDEAKPLRQSLKKRCDHLSGSDLLSAPQCAFHEEGTWLEPRLRWKALLACTIFGGVGIYKQLARPPYQPRPG